MKLLLRLEWHIAFREISKSTRRVHLICESKFIKNYIIAEGVSTMNHELDYLPIDTLLENIFNSEEGLKTRKLRSLQLQQNLRGSIDERIKAIASRMSRCADYFYIHRIYDISSGVEKDLYMSRYCRLSYCPICGQRRCNEWVRRFSDILPLIGDEKHKKYKFLFLTISPRNCRMSELKKEIDKMNFAWGKLIKTHSFRKAFKNGGGWVRVIEAKPGKCYGENWTPESTNLHIHALLYVPVNFKCDAKEQREWATLWRRSMKLDHCPEINIGRRKGNANKFKEALKILRYMTKPIKLEKVNPVWAREYVIQIRGHRLITTGGIIRKTLRKKTCNWKFLPSSENDGSMAARWNADVEKYERYSQTFERSVS